MKSKPNRSIAPQGGDDCIRTPDDLAARIVQYFGPSGRCIDPCFGDGAFHKALPKGSHWCEITQGLDFLTLVLPHYA
jgi:hypothetical protein